MKIKATALCFVFAAGLAPAADQAADLAPTGTLRAVFLGDNPVQGRVDPKTGAITGPVADLVQELARRLKVPFKLIPAPGARVVIDQVNAHTADIGFLAYEAARAREVDFSGGYAVMRNTYVVPASSSIHGIAEVDRAGVRVGAVQGQSQQIYLSENLKQAKVRIFAETPSQEELVKLLESGEIEAFGANRQRMEEAAALSKQIRVLPDNFSSATQAIVIEKGAPDKMAEINRFLDDVRSSGFVKTSLGRAKLIGVEVAPK
ncbi:MAG TPA: transporter substrate-binding domain-containing protein [Bryobacteraceae bacterium]|jgi:polar amino acid transport system substrate-binding protein|nr:transporter substrate-binding domain-containing protein [Bryobacteraceae bacterium]